MDRKDIIGCMKELTIELAGSGVEPLLVVGRRGDDFIVGSANHCRQLMTQEFRDEILAAVTSFLDEFNLHPEDRALDSTIEKAEETRRRRLEARDNEA